MQKTIYRYVVAIVMSALIVFAVAATAISYFIYSSQAKSELIDIAKIVLDDENSMTGDEIYQAVSSVRYNIRVTVIDINGAVIYDSSENAAEMDNHSNRPEVSEAIKEGSASSTRKSDTLNKTTCYYAVLHNNTVVRFARDVESILSILTTLIPFMIIIAAVIMIISIIMSYKLSARIVKPVTELVKQIDVTSENTQIETDCEELIPVAQTIKRLSRKLSVYLKRLQNEKENINLIINRMSEGMILLDNDLYILSVNSSCIEMLNPQFELSEKKSFAELSRNPQLIELLQKAQNNGRASGELEREQGFFDAFINKTEEGYVCIIVDTTEKNRNEQIRRDFSANVSHELKTPLTTIKGFAEMINSGAIYEKQDIIKYTGLINREGERLLSLINDIIRLSEIEENRPIENCLFDVSKIANDVVSSLKFKADEKDLKLSLNSENIQIMANQSYINELITNLADNSIKYNVQGGRVDISISRHEGNLKIIVSDTGIGIPKEHQERIFERFYRVDKSRSKQTGGTGLGLSIVKHIVLMYKGTINLDSKVDEGTKITIILPI